MFALIRAVYNLVNNILNFIASIAPFIIIMAATSAFVPDGIVKIQFEDGSYFEINDFDDGRLCSSNVRFHNQDGSFYGSDLPYYLKQDEKRK